MKKRESPKQEIKYRCEFMHTAFMNTKLIEKYKCDNKPQCWMTETKKHDDKYLCVFHIPKYLINFDCEVEQSRTLKILILEWIQDKNKNSQEFVLQGMNCGGVNFSGYIFKGPINFTNAIFKGFADFREATFKGIVDFRGAKFIENARFDNSKFSKYTCFKEVEFRKNIVFDQVIFSDYATFDGAEFGKYSPFNMTIFYLGPFMNGCKFLDKAPSFHDAQFSQSVDFRNAVFRDTKSYEAASCYRTLKFAMNKHSNKKYEAFFYGLEQKSLRSQSSTPKMEKTISLLYEISSNYGQSIIRPFIVLFLFNILSAVIYSFIKFPMTKILTYFYQGAPEFVNKLALMFEFTMKNIISPFKVWSTENTMTTFGTHLEKYQVVLINLISSFQSVISLILITLFILAVRRTFKLS